MRKLMSDAVFALIVFAVCFIGGCGKESPTNTLPPPDQGTLLLSQLSVSVVPGGIETVAVCATDQDGSTDNCTITCSAPGVATATISDSTITITGVTYGTANVTVTSGSGMTRNVPVQVYNPFVLDTGELLVTFVDTYTHLCGDNIAVHHPVVPAGYHSVGSLATNHTDPNGNKAMMVVKAKDGSDALAPPTGYELLLNHDIYVGPYWVNGIWDIVGIWRPIPPDGYVALGCVATGVRDTVPIVQPVPPPSQPSLDYIVCVREDLTADAEIGTCIGRDQNYNFGYWFIDQPDAGPHEFCYLVAGTIFGWNQYEPPAQHEALHVLDFELPMLAEAPYQTLVPRLTGYDTPPGETVPMMSKAMLVPCTIINDQVYEDNLGWQVANSPLYRLERQVYYRLQYHNHNQTELQQTNSVTIRSGITSTESQRIWEETEISVSVELGLSIKAFSGSVTGTFSRKFGYETQTSVAELQERAVSTSINTPPFKSAACWQKFNRYVLYRHNGTALEPVTSWEFGIDSYVTDQYPDN